MALACIWIRRRSWRTALLTTLWLNLHAFGTVRADEPGAPAAPLRTGYADSKLGAQAPGPPSPALPSPQALPSPPSGAMQPGSRSASPAPVAQLGSDITLLPIDLPYALRLVNASNPTIAVARERVREAYARLGQAQVLWIPNLWLGGNPDNSTFLPNFFVHQGNIQNSRGDVFDTVKSFASFSAGTGMNLSISDAIFAPRIARNLAAAEEARRASSRTTCSSTWHSRTWTCSKCMALLLSTRNR